MTTAAVNSMFNTMELLRQNRNAGFEDEQARKKAKWDDEDRATKMAEQARLLEERKRADDLRTQLQADAAPVEVEEVEQAGPLQPDAAPMPAMSQIKGKTFASRELADKAAAEQNAPQAVMQRQSMTALRAGNPEGAARVMETGMKLGEAERKVAHDAYLKKVRGSAGWNDLSKVMDEAGDPNAKGRFRPSEDGKSMVMERANPDGSFEPITEFPNTPAGFAKARAIAEGVTAEQLLQHEDRVQARADQREDRKEDRLWRREDKESERKFRASMLSQKAAAGAPKEVDPEANLKDRRDALSDYDKLLGPVPEDADETVKAARTQALAQADGLFQLNAQAGVQLTAPEIRTASRLAADPKQRRIIKNTDNGQEFEAVVVNGRPVIVGIVRGRAAPQATPAPQPAAPGQAPAAPAKPQAPPPSMRETLTSGAGKDAILQKIMSEKAPAIEQAIQAHQQAKQVMRSVAASGDPRSIAIYAKQLQDARNALMQLTAGLPPATQAQALAAADK